MSITELVSRDDKEGIATLTLNNASAINALSESMMAALCSQLDSITDDSSVRVVILRGAGKHFCAGHNLKEMIDHRGDSDGGRDYFLELFQISSHMMLRLVRLPQPVIAEVSGVATAAGCQLVASCDLAVASDEATFATSGINVGLFCSTPMVALSRNVSRKHALEMLFTGEFINAHRAADIGLVNKVVSGSHLADATRELAIAIAAKSPAAIRLGKRAFYDQATMKLEDAYKLAGEAMASNMMTSDADAGITAFINKQPIPEWSGK